MINNPNSIPAKKKEVLSPEEFLRQKRQKKVLSPEEFLRQKRRRTEPDTALVTTPEVPELPEEKAEERSRNPIVNFGQTFWNVASKQIPGALKAGYSALYEDPVNAALKADEIIRKAFFLPDQPDVSGTPVKEAADKRALGIRKDLMKSALKNFSDFQTSQAGAVSTTDDIEDGIDLINYVANSVAQAGAQIPASLLTAGGSSVGQEIGIIYMDQVKKIAEKEGITPEEVIEQGLDDRASAAAYGAFAGSLDALGAKGVTKILPKKQLRNSLARRALGFLKSAGTEGVTEGSQSIIEQFGASHGAGDSLMKSLTGVNLKEAYEEGMAGAVGGGGVNIVSQVQDAVARKKKWHDQVKSAEDFLKKKRAKKKVPTPEEFLRKKRGLATKQETKNVPTPEEFLKQKRSEQAESKIKDEKTGELDPELKSNDQQSEDSTISGQSSDKAFSLSKLRKSASGNSNPPFAPQGDFFRDGFSDIDDNIIDKIRVKIEDQYLDLKRYQQKSEEVYGPLPDEVNPYQEEELFSGRVEHDINQFKKTYEEPILELIHEMGWTIEDAEEFLMARHAEERNDQIASINPDLPDGGSGMITSEANDILNEVYSGEKSETAQQLGELWDRMTKFQRDLLLESGLAKEETIRNWENAYMHYISLKGGERTSGKSKSGSGFDVLDRFKKATGRTSRAENAIAQTLAEIRTDIVRAEKTNVGKSLLKFVNEHPNPELWEVDKVDYSPTVNRSSGLVEYKYDPRYKLADNVLNVKVDGQNHHITFHSERGKRLAKSLKNLGTENSGALLRGLNRMTRYLAMINTGFNPEFMVSNFIRDVQTAGINLSSTDAESLRGQILRDVFKARRGMSDFISDKTDSEWSNQAKNFVEIGGKTGWIDAYKSVDEMQRNLDKELKRMSRKKGDPRQLLRKSFDYIQKLNDSVENAVRLSAFKHARVNGLTDKQAASLAKNLTVNFNRKGQWGPMLNAMYMFYGASMNGTMRIFQSVKSPKARKLIGELFLGSIALDMINRMVAGEDDDDVSYYDKIPQWIKERNLILMIPGSEGEYITIPSPYGYNVVNVAGMELGKATSHAMLGNPVYYKPEDSAINIGSSFLSAFNPVGAGGSFNQAIAPTVLDPFIQTGQNIDWTGQPIKPPANPFDRSPTPESQQSYSSTPGWAKKASKTINDITGGSDAVPGRIDIAPDYLDHWFRFITGGVGNFLNESATTVLNTASGEETEPHQIPFVGKVYGEVNETSTYSRYRDYIRNIEYAEADLENALIQNDKQKAERIKGEKDTWLKHTKTAKNIERRIQKLRKRRKIIEASDTSFKEKKKSISEIDQVINELQKSLIKSVNSSMKEDSN